MTDSIPTEEFKNDNITVELERKPGCEVTCNVIVHAPAAKVAYQSALKKVSKEVSLPGFRKGKAPVKLIVDQFGTHVEREWRDTVLQTSFKEVIKLTNTYPVNERSVKTTKMESCDQENGAVILFVYESEPNIPEIKAEDLTVDAVDKKEVQDADVDKAVDEMALHYSDWEKVEDKDVEEGDFVDLTIDNLNMNPPASICKDRRFEINKGKIGGWLMNLTIGMKPGETKEGKSEVDAEATEEVKQKFQETLCSVTVNAIQKAIKPEIDDELAKKAGLSSLDEMKKQIRAQLEKEAVASERAQLKAKLQDSILEKYTFDLPKSLVEEERQLRIKERIRNLMSEGLSEDDIKNREQEIEGEVAQEVINALKIFFLTRKYSEQEKIQVTNEETATAIMEQMYRFPTGGDKPEIPPEVYAQVFSNLLIDKVKNHLLDKIQSK